MDEIIRNKKFFMVLTAAAILFIPFVFGELSLEIRAKMNNFDTSFIAQTDENSSLGYDSNDFDATTLPSNYSQFYSSITGHTLAIDSWNTSTKIRYMNLTYHTSNSEAGTLNLTWTLSDWNFEGTLTDYGYDNTYTTPTNDNLDLRTNTSYLSDVNGNNRYFKLEVEWSRCPARMNGSGTAADPCMITNCTQLQKMNLNLTAYYALNNSIDCSETYSWNWDGSKYLGFNPVGNSSNNFTGSFDGRNKTITGLYINRREFSIGFGIALFGYTYNSFITNVGLENVNITGLSKSAGLVGTLYAGTINNSYSTGIINGSLHSGGLVGNNEYGKIYNSYSAANIVASATTAGGLVGYNKGNITNCYAIGNVSSNSVHAGGLVGETDNSASYIKNSFAAGNVSGTTTYNSVSGLVGISNGIVQNSYYNNVSYACVGNDTGTVNCTAIQNNLNYFQNDVYPNAQGREPFAKWDFTKIWQEKANDYPVLKWQGTGSSVESTDLYACGNLTKANNVYTLMQDLNVSGTCFVISANNITLNGNNHRIKYKKLTDDALYGVYSDKNGITVKNLILDQDNSVGNSVFPIYFEGTVNGTITNNTIITQDVMFAIALHNAVSYTNITNNNITIRKDSDYGIYFSGDIGFDGMYDNIINNSILISGENSGGGNYAGIYLSSVFYSNIENNTITSSNGSGSGIYLSSGNFYNRIRYNNINLSGSGSYGIFSSLFWSIDNTFLNNNITIFNGSSFLFDFTTVSSTYIVYNNSYGEIRWPVEVNPGAGDLYFEVNGSMRLPGNVEIGNNTAYVNSSAVKWDANRQANVTLYGIGDRGFLLPTIKKDGAKCMDCSNFTGLAEEVVKFSVTSFSNYTIADALGLTNCDTLDQANKVYTLQNNVSSVGNCFNITANNVTLDGNGYKLTYATSSSNSYGIYSNRDQTLIKNLLIEEGGSGNNNSAVYFSGSTNGNVVNNTITGSDYGVFYTGSTSNYISNNTYNNNDADISIELNSLYEANITNTKLEIRNDAYGKIKWYNPLTFNYNNLSAISFASLAVYADSELMPEINSSAKITLYGLSCSTSIDTVTMKMAGSDCSSSVCTEITKAAAYVFNVTHFTMYGVSYTCTSGGTSCFPAGTLIKMADGSDKNIEEVKVGDYVLGYDTKSEKQIVSKVLETEQPIHYHLYTLNFANNKTLRTTVEHPIYVNGKGWSSIDPAITLATHKLKVNKLEPGDYVLNSDNELVRLLSYSHEEKPEGVQTYNLKKVSGTYNYYADDILVHNKGGDCTPQCGGKSCGSDSCGGSCGSCGAGESCSGGKCVGSRPPVVVPPVVGAGAEQNLACVNITKKIGTYGMAISDMIDFSLIPEDYTTIISPFKIECPLRDSNFAVLVPDNYKDIKVLKCSGENCFKGESEFVTEQWCNNNYVDTVGRFISSPNANLTNVDINEADLNVTKLKESLSIGGNRKIRYSQEFEDLVKTVSSTGLEVNKLISTESYNSSLDLGYKPEQGAKDMLILVHGVLSSPETYKPMIDDLRFTNQPIAVYTFSYSLSKTIDQISNEFMDILETNTTEYDNIYIIAHSAGGIIAQQALFNASNKGYNFVNKVRREILIATPNEGSPLAEVYENLLQARLNDTTEDTIFDIKKDVIKDLVKGRIIPRVKNVEYYVIAGTKPYELNIPLFKSEDFFGDYEVSDGVVTTKSAQHVGEGYINNKCKNYWELQLTHNELISSPIARKVIENIIAKDILNKETILGNGKYFEFNVDKCNPDEVYIVVGKKIKDNEIEDPSLCNCGNGMCGVGENVFNCPEDCAFFLSNLKGIPLWLYAILISALLLLVFTGVRYVEVFQYRMPKASKEDLEKTFHSLFFLVEDSLAKKEFVGASSLFNDLKKTIRALNNMMPKEEIKIFKTKLNELGYSLKNEKKKNIGIYREQLALDTMIRRENSKKLKVYRRSRLLVWLKAVLTLRKPEIKIEKPAEIKSAEQIKQYAGEKIKNLPEKPKAYPAERRAGIFDVSEIANKSKSAISEHAQEHARGFSSAVLDIFRAKPITKVKEKKPSILEGIKPFEKYSSLEEEKKKDFEKYEIEREIDSRRIKDYRKFLRKQKISRFMYNLGLRRSPEVLLTKPAAEKIKVKEIVKKPLIMEEKPGIFSKLFRKELEVPKPIREEKAIKHVKVIEQPIAVRPSMFGKLFRREEPEMPKIGIKAKAKSEEEIEPEIRIMGKPSVFDRLFAIKPRERSLYATKHLIKAKEKPEIKAKLKRSLKKDILVKLLKENFAIEVFKNRVLQSSLNIKEIKKGPSKMHKLFEHEKIRLLFGMPRLKPILEHKRIKGEDIKESVLYLLKIIDDYKIQIEKGKRISPEHQVKLFLRYSDVYSDLAYSDINSGEKARLVNKLKEAYHELKIIRNKRDKQESLMNSLVKKTRKDFRKR